MTFPRLRRSAASSAVESSSRPRSSRPRSSRRGRGFKVWTLAALPLLGAASWGLWRHFRAPQTLTNWAQKSAPISVGARDRYDVLVVGGTPSGVAAAVAASRRGARVLLVEARPRLGGDVYYAMLNQFDVPVNKDKGALVHGLFAEVYQKLGIAFSIEHGRDVFEAMARREPNLEIMMRTRVTQILKNGKRVVGAELQTDSSTRTPDFGARTDSNSALPTLTVSPLTQNGARRAILANVVVDATNDADFATRAGSGFYLGRENVNPDKKMQSAGLLFSVSGVNWRQVQSYVRGRRLMNDKEKARQKAARQQTLLERIVNAKKQGAQGASAAKRAQIEYSKLMQTAAAPRKNVWLQLGGVHGAYAWERGDIIKPYVQRGADVIMLSINFGRQQDASVVLNTLNLLNVNGLDAASRQRARDEGLRELPFFIAYLQKKMPGFQKAKLKQAAPELYIRETRHVHGLYMLKESDIIGQRLFFDRVAMASYPIDLHPYERHTMNPYGPRRHYYTLPLRALIPKNVDGVFVASRSLSATYAAAGSCRVIPITMAAGEAAGVAAWLCATKNISPHDLIGRNEKEKPLANLHLIQRSLRDGDADIGDDIPRLLHEKTQQDRRKPRRSSE